MNELNSDLIYFPTSSGSGLDDSNLFSANKFENCGKEEIKVFRNESVIDSCKVSPLDRLSINNENPILIKGGEKRNLRTRRRNKKHSTNGTITNPDKISENNPDSISEIPVASQYMETIFVSNSSQQTIDINPNDEERNILPTPASVGKVIKKRLRWKKRLAGTSTEIRTELDQSSVLKSDMTQISANLKLVNSSRYKTRSNECTQYVNCSLEKGKEINCKENSTKDSSTLTNINEERDVKFPESSEDLTVLISKVKISDSSNISENYTVISNDAEINEVLIRKTTKKRVRSKKKSTKTPLENADQQDKEQVFVFESDTILTNLKLSDIKSTENTQDINLDTSCKKKRRKRKDKQKKESPKKTNKFENYMSRAEVLEGLENKTLLKGEIRINRGNYREAYINNPDKGTDIFIDGVTHRNRALEGDEVVVKLNPESEWKEQRDGLQMTGKVVYILHQNHPRVTAGILKPMKDSNSDYALFVPRDHRVPRIKIHLSQCPVQFLQNPDEFSKTIFLASIERWDNSNYALGKLFQEAGFVGTIEAEKSAILAENGINTKPYSEELLQFCPPDCFTIPEEELVNRFDFRKECIFTIDPITAKDLDDAVSCKLLDNGNFEVGVHIADLSYFLKPNTPFDEEVSKRATSTYLVDQVFHMLPKMLCQQCSLLPGEDKLTFSVVWEMTPEAKIISQRIGRSVINSCTQLAYEHAQNILECPDKEWTIDDLPKIHGGFTPKDVAQIVSYLHKLAVILRKSRYSAGALAINQTKLEFKLDESGQPQKFFVSVIKDANRLIEEFMLLANRTVAEKLSHHFPSTAFLRNHPEPSNDLLQKLQGTFEKIGIHLDISSSGSLQSTMWQYNGDDFVSQSRMMVINSLCARTMKRAEYFCIGLLPEKEKWWHYALSVPLYTHFTSPIRRYADVMVHRLLGASLGYCDVSNWTEEYVHRIAKTCNQKKYAAKLAQEQSDKLYITLYIKRYGPLYEKAVVVDVKDHSFDVLITSMGFRQRIFVDKLDAVIEYECIDCLAKLVVNWKPPDGSCNFITQVIELFTIVDVKLECLDDIFSILGMLMKPCH